MNKHDPRPVFNVVTEWCYEHILLPASSLNRPCLHISLRVWVCWCFAEAVSISVRFVEQSGRHCISSAVGLRQGNSLLQEETQPPFNAQIPLRLRVVEPVDRLGNFR